MEETMQPHKENEKASPIWLCLSIFFIIFILINFLAPILFQTIGLLKDAHTNSIESVLLMQITMLTSVVIAAIISLRIEGKPFSDLGLSFSGHSKDLFYGMTIAIVIYVIGFGILLLMGAVKVTSWNFNPLGLIYSLFFYILVSLTEEIMVR